MIQLVTKHIYGFLMRHSTEQTRNNDMLCDVYWYGIELVVSSIINVLLIITIGLITGHFYESLIFLFCFILLRQFTGGYHANTYLKCNIVFALVFSLILGVNWLLSPGLTLLPAIIIVAINGFIIARFAPIPNPNKFVDPKRYPRLRQKSIAIWAVFSGTAIMLVAFNWSYGTIILLTLSVISFLMIVSLCRKEATR